MPTKRTRVSRAHQAVGISASEMTWLTGIPQPGANKFSRPHLASRERVARARHLLAEHADLVPPGRIPQLLRNIEFWVSMTDAQHAELMAELRLLRAAIERRQVPRAEQHVALLAAIAESAGDTVFSVAELQRHAEVDPVLREAIAGQNGRQLGKLLRRIENRELGGWAIERVGEGSDGVSWVVKPRKPMLRIA